MKFHIITIFPEIFDSYFQESLLKRAQERKLLEIHIHNLRNWATDPHKTVDDSPFGGGLGMVMKVEPIYRAVESIKKKIRKGSPSTQLRAERRKLRIVLLSAKGKILTQQKVRSLAKYDQIILIAGHYKGVDERVAKYVVDEELSIGEYVITGGELPAMVVVDAVSRMFEGVIGKEISKEGESFSILGRSGRPREIIRHEHPVYTRPEVFSPKRGVNWKVPKVLVSGHHKNIEEWRQKSRKLDN